MLIYESITWLLEFFPRQYLIFNVVLMTCFPSSWLKQNVLHDAKCDVFALDSQFYSKGPTWSH